ncbi:hypothetical protein OPV22_004250 [Ensete ventricosum]|uniref:Uncharacterized protein n=1 Tax=Ensete ventricosum TaxID=4639 RepID=A0AAV8S3A2_ENSVE|nr:hypothetical protein OPV22_004250 [Ensete ventricosum]
MRPRCSSNLVAIALCHGHRRPTLARCHDAVGNMIFPPPPNESLPLPWSRLRHAETEAREDIAGLIISTCSPPERNGSFSPIIPPLMISSDSSPAE